MKPRKSNMTVKLPRVSGYGAVKALSKAGWGVIRQKGSHVHMAKEGMPLILTIPLHKELKKGLLHSQIKKAGLAVEEFIELL